MAAEQGVLDGMARARANGIDFQNEMLYEIMVASSGGTGGITQDEFFEVMDGTNPEGKASGIFENTTGFDFGMPDLMALMFTELNGESVFQTTSLLGNRDSVFKDNNSDSVFLIDNPILLGQTLSVFKDVDNNGVFMGSDLISVFIDNISGLGVFKQSDGMSAFVDDGGLSTFFTSLGVSVFKDEVGASAFIDDAGNTITSVLETFRLKYAESVSDGTTSNSAFLLDSGQSVFKDVLDNSYLALIRAGVDDINTSLDTLLLSTDTLIDQALTSNDYLESILDQQPFENYGDIAGSKALTTKELLRAGLTYMTGGNIYNPNASTIFIKFYDAATTAAVTVGTTPVDYMLPIPPLGSVILENTSCPKKKFVNGIVMVAGTAFGDADVMPPAIGAYVSVINFNDVVI